MSVSGSTRLRPSSAGKKELRLSWASVVLVPVAFLAAMAVGEGLFATTGYDPSAEAVPAWAILVAGLPALLVLAVPGVAAAYFGWRAYRAGRPAGLWPVLIGSAAAVLGGGLNLVALLFG